MVNSLRLTALVLGMLIQVNMAAAAAGSNSKPNVILIMADDLGARDLGCYGSKFYKTPNLDKMAASGIQFQAAYAACPVCSPTRAALLTGKYPARLHLTDWLPGRGDLPGHKLARPKFLQHLPLEETTVAEVFKKHGYKTAIMGKWHLGGTGFEPTKQGFDLNIAGDETGTALSYWAPFERNGRKMTGLEVAPEKQYLTDRLGLEAEKFVEAHKDQPFFLYLPHYAPHTPMTANPEVIATFPKWDGTPHGRQENPIYAAMLVSLDEAVGRVIDAVDRNGLGEKTMILFTSDNGGLATKEGGNTPATYNGPLREGKGWVYEGGIRVPLLVRWTGKIKAGADTTPVWSGDLLPTLIDLAGITEPAAVDGKSLAKLMLEGTPLEPRSLYWHYPHYANQGSPPSGAIRAGDWKFTQNDITGRQELYNLSKDPSESTNLADKEPARLATMAKELADWRASVDAQPATPNPGYRPNPEDKQGVVTMHASTAEVHGIMLRYEPLAHKSTLGYWVRPDDWAAWEFEVASAGEFEVEALVGCGNGSGGSQVDFLFEDQTLKLTVPVTGGFQSFQPQALGKVKLEKAGRHTVEVRPRSKPGGAVMDLRQVKLTRVKPAS